ncbi:hypothetical protein BJY24_000147 [Nocardia transvalensis]|uniref:Uncharacterized protein n=1 Tax=Nocardia transvalensis TaxID=37333 RepID=A0A7W9UG23_9NOCA|nr:hypothetical protein [Nocardia transvalensis]MBB5911280.1 hypothetical protein [Nocardia transvalensis]
MFRQEMGNKLALRSGWTHRFWRAWLDEDGPQVQDRAAQNSLYDWQVKTVCAPCNNGWMNDLDLAVETILVDLAEGRETEIVAARADSLVAWAAKTVAVYASGEPGRFIISRSELDWIYRCRTAPPMWQVWAARADLDEDHQILARHLRGIGQLLSLGDEPVHVTAIAQKQFVVFVRGTAGIQDGEYGVHASSSIIDEQDARFVQLTRRSTSDVSLAGRKALTRDQILAVVERLLLD